MDDRTRATAAVAAAAARELLQGYKAEQAGWTDDRTPVDDLVSWLGLEVETFHPNDYPQGGFDPKRWRLQSWRLAHLCLNRLFKSNRTDIL